LAAVCTAALEKKGANCSAAVKAAVMCFIRSFLFWPVAFRQCVECRFVQSIGWGCWGGLFQGIWEMQEMSICHV
jgi:hypothetical protein